MPLWRSVPRPLSAAGGIPAGHAQAPCFEQTDWPQIAALYGELARRSPSPVIEVNRAGPWASRTARWPA
jgi:predicted RNA polymerase sigma factor